MTIFLIATGVLSAVIVAFPLIVLLAIFLGPLGFFLMWVPTIFLVASTFQMTRAVLTYGGVSGREKAAVIAGAVTALVFFALPLPAYWQAQRLLAGVVLPDVTPQAPIRLSGVVRLDAPINGCDNICAALLMTPGVTAVTLPGASGRQALTYRLVPVGDPRQAVETGSFGIARVIQDNGLRRNPPVDLARAAWNLKLASGLKLVADRESAGAEFTINRTNGPIHRTTSNRWSLAPRPGWVDTLTITDRSGEVLLRSQVAGIATPAFPLRTSLGGELESSNLFGWTEIMLSKGVPVPQRTIFHWLGATPGPPRLDLTDLILTHTTIARVTEAAGITDAVRPQLVSALDNPSAAAGDAGLRLAGQWMNSIAGRTPLSDEDAALVERIVRDRRIVSTEGMYLALRAMGPRAVGLRETLLARVVETAATYRDKDWYGVLDALPVGTFAAPLPQEQALLADVVTSRRALVLIRRQAERGRDALPDLLRLLETFASTATPPGGDWSDTRDAISSVQSALLRLGPEAAPALPQVEALFEKYERLRRTRDTYWDATLVAMGMPLERVVKPAYQSGTEEQYRARVQRLAAQRPRE
ncbi:hypothetical protein [Phreatobacter oligotrophus]|uniref:Uncharacterized protein n=1 Tax=Phreatobacter oligotrophus TaxID=1122261 RepID=A0A2T4ZGP0_9HYPH|nr:hypothetical protein [Phreatobacter oligotrophus]PTM61095.1 hypothetical protein C8P69_102481 [Phreatobacter oligotrophus]